MKLSDILASDDLDEAMNEFREIGGRAIWCFVADLASSVQSCEAGPHVTEDQRQALLRFLIAMLHLGPDREELKDFAFDAVHKALKIAVGKKDWRSILRDLDLHYPSLDELIAPGVKEGPGS